MGLAGRTCQLIISPSVPRWFPSFSRVPIMTPLLDLRPPSATPGSVLRWVSTSNPFYVVSAALFLAGLRLSFETIDGDAAIWSLMSGLTGYTLLLAVTACLLVRSGNVWDDVRTV